MNFDEISALLKENKKESFSTLYDFIKKLDREQKSKLLLIASFINNIELAKFLIENGADCNYKDTDDCTPLHLTTNPELMVILLKNQAKTEVLNNHNHLPQTPLAKAVQDGNIECANILLDYKADINGFSWDNETPLHVAIDNDQTEIAEQLLNRRADPNIQDNYGRTALHAAAETGNLEVAKLLVPRITNINSLNIDGDTPLHVAAKYNVESEFIRWLINYIQDKNILNSHGQTLLHVAKNPEIVKFLINLGLDINAQDVHGNTPMHCAVLEDNLEKLVIISGFGPNFELKNNLGLTPLQLAVQNKADKLARYIMKKLPSKTK